MRRLRLLIGINVFWLAISLLFDGLSSLVLPVKLLAVMDQEQTATSLGIITFVGLLAAMLIQPVAGLFSDRLRPRWGRGGSLALGVCFTLLGLALFGAARTFVLLLVGYLLVQLAASVAQAAQQAFLPDLVDEESRGAASGLKMVMDLGGAFLGFALLGQLLREGNSTPALLAIGSIVMTTFALTLVLVREPRRRRPQSQARPALADAFRLDLAEQRPFAWLILSRFLFLLGVYAVGRFLLLFVADRLGLPPGRAAEEAGLLLAALTLVTLVAALPAGWLSDRLGRFPLMLAGTILSAAGVLGYIWASNMAGLLLAGGFMSLGSAAFSSANWALTADMVPQKEAARYFALANFGTAGAAAAAGLFGPLIDGANALTPGSGYPALFLAAATCFLASAAALAPLRIARHTAQFQVAGVKGAPSKDSVD